MTKKKTKILIYLDSNVVLGHLEHDRRNPANNIFFKELRKHKNWMIVISTLTKSEVLETLNESSFIIRQATSGYAIREIIRHQQSRENTPEEKEKNLQRLSDFTQQWKNKIVNVDCEGDEWDIALDVSFKYDISTPDAIHIASAIRGSVDVFITEDGPLYNHMITAHDDRFSFLILHCSKDCDIRNFLGEIEEIEKKKIRDYEETKKNIKKITNKVTHELTVNDF